MPCEFTQVERTLRNNLTALRRSCGLSQEQLAFEADIDRTYVSQIERGLGNPSLAVMCRLACALGVGICDLLDGDATP